MIQGLTLLEGGKEGELLDKACLHEGSVGAGRSHDVGDDQQIITQLTVVVTVALRQLEDESIAQLAAHTEQFTW